MAQEAAPSSGSSSTAPGSGGMVRVVIEQIGNGVDCLKRAERAPRAVAFPLGSRLLDMDDARVRDLVMVGLERAGVGLPTDATVVGCAYEVGAETHLCAWIEPAAPSTVVSRVADLLRNNPVPRRWLVASLLLAVYMIPSPFEWDKVIAGAVPLVRMVRAAAPCGSAHAETVPPICQRSGPLCGADVNGQ